MNYFTSGLKSFQTDARLFVFMPYFKYGIKTNTVFVIYIRTGMIDMSSTNTKATMY